MSQVVSCSVAAHRTPTLVDLVLPCAPEVKWLPKITLRSPQASGDSRIPPGIGRRDMPSGAAIYVYLARYSNNSVRHLYIGSTITDGDTRPLRFAKKRREDLRGALVYQLATEIYVAAMPTGMSARAWEYRAIPYFMPALNDEGLWATDEDCAEFGDGFRRFSAYKGC